jgi:hypothetical protein
MPAAKYFTGQSVTTWVSSCPATTFRELVETCIHTPIPLALTQDGFMAMPKAARDKYKRDKLTLLTPAAFKADNVPRKTENATVCNLIFLDIDEDKKTGVCPAAPFVKNPQILRDQLAPLAFVAYHTISSTPEKPRIRIMVSADAIPLSLYPAAVATIAQRIGLTIITPESEVAVQPMFLPVLFAGQHIDEHPTFCGELIGEALQPRQVHDVEMDEIMGVEPKGYASDKAHNSEDALAFLRPPVPEITLEIAKDALSHVDPDIEMLPWIAMASALKHQFSHKHAAEAFEIFDEWSAKGTKKYLGRDDTLTKWNCIQPTPVGRVPVTIRSLIHAAVDGGYNAAPVKEVSFNSVLNWIREEGRTKTDLTTVALQKIMAAVMLSDTEEGVLLNAVIKHAKKLGIDASIGDLRKDLKKLKTKAAQKDESQDSKEMPGWLKGWCYVTSRNEFFQHRTTRRMDCDAFNNAFGRKLLPDPATAGEDADPAVLSKPIIRPQDFALNLHKIQCVDGYRYTPSEPGKIYTKKEGLWYVNTYRANFPTPTKEYADEAKALIDKHLEVLIANPQYRSVLWDWMAFNVQFPGVKARWAVLFQGGAGCGKTFFFKLMLAVLGQGHAKLVNKASISGNWNEWATGAQLVGIEEIRVTGENRYEIMNKLKELITNDDIPVNQRNKDTRTEENITNYIAFSNHHDALALAHDDRRYFVLKAILQEEEEIKALSETGYFTALFDLLKERAGALRYVFENYPISSDFDANGRAPYTIFRDQVIEDTSDEVTTLIRRLIEEGEHVQVNSDFIVAKDLSAIFNLEGAQGCSDHQLAQRLRNLGYHSGKRSMLDGKKQTIWVRNGRLKDVTDLGAYVRQKMEDQKKIADIW